MQSSKKAQKDLRVRKDDLETIRINDLRSVLSTPAGRRFIFDLIDRRCLVFSPSYTGNSETYLREGMRKVGIDLMREIQERFLDQYTTMLSEQFTLVRQNQRIEDGAKNKAMEDDNG